MSDTKPAAPESAVDTIIKTFRGRRVGGQLTKLLLSFDNRSDQQNAANLINMLHGWSAEEDPNQVGLVSVYKAP